MKKIWILFIVLVLFKILLVSFVTAPSIFSDEYFYAEIAESIIESKAFKIHGNPVNVYPPLYPLIIAPAYLFNDIDTTYTIIKLINAIISSFIIFPVFLLGKEFMRKKFAFIASIIAGIMPMSFSFSGFIMSENAFYTLFMFSIWFMYKSLTENKTKWHILLGVGIGLCILTKVIGLLLVPLYALSSMLVHFKYEKQWLKRTVIKGSLVGLMSFITTFPWIIRNIRLEGLVLQIIAGLYGQEITVATKSGNPWVFSFIIWFIIYCGMVALASGIIMPATAIQRTRKKERKWFTLTTISIIASIGFISAAANHAAKSVVKGAIQWLPGRPIGRYVDTILPLIVIIGLAGLSLYKRKNKTIEKNLIIIIGMLFIASIALTFELFLANNLSLSWIGGISYLSKKIFGTIIGFTISVLILIGISLMTIIINRTVGFNNKKVFVCLLVYFLVASLMAIGITAWNSASWYRSEQNEIGRWIAKNIPQEKNIIIDEATCKNADLRETGVLCNSKKDTTAIGFWIRNEISIRNSEAIKEGEIFISSEKQALERIKEFEHFTLYTHTMR